jgi:hypothetical protein
MSKMNVVIEVQDATAFSVHPVVGRSGKTYGTAVYCPKRGCMALRLGMDEWREAREDICTARHRFYPLVIDFEESEAAAEPVVPLVEAEPVAKKSVVKKAPAKKAPSTKAVKARK